LTREVGYHDLMEALAGQGCPACRVAAAAARRYLDGLLWEHVNDSGIRQRLRRDRGFCRRHALVAAAVAKERGDGLGMAIIYDDVLRAIEHELASATTRRARRTDRDLLPRACSACDTARRTAENSLDVLAKAAEGSAPWRGIREPGRGLCLPHLAAGLDRHPADPGAARLREAFLHGARALRDELGEYVRKHDYRFMPEGFTDEEATAWLRAVYRVAGGTEPRSRRP
jgi:hypothetical protein